MKELNKGDLVKLKSGGPTMTIMSFNSTNHTIRCGWFIKEELKEAMFTEESLLKLG